MDIAQPTVTPTTHPFSHLHADKATFPQIDLHYDRNNPLTIPVVISLPANGFRLRFDGADQRLRLIEITDFTKLRLTYKGSEIAKDGKPGFKRVYQLFGASYPGEYHSPPKGHRDRTGRYVLSWAGVAFTFPLQHEAWSAQKDHVSLLGSNAAGAATSIAIFEGASWPEARHDLFVRRPTGPRLSALASRTKDQLPAEIEVAHIRSLDGQIELVRRPPAAPFTIILNQTSPQDLITELGPPDATHKRESSFSISPTATTQPQQSHRRTSSAANGRASAFGNAAGSQPSSYSSTGTDTFDADFDSGDADEDPADRSNREIFWCYFNHGFDLLLGPPNEERGQRAPGNNRPSSADPAEAGYAPNGATPLSASPHLVVNKVVLHGNVPGSYAFNRHRRLRWELQFPNTEYLSSPLDSEMKFEDLRTALLHILGGDERQRVGDGKRVSGQEQQAGMGKGKVLNRTWGPGSGLGGGGGGSGLSESGFFLPDAEKDLVEGGGSEAWLGNSRVFSFPVGEVNGDPAGAGMGAGGVNRGGGESGALGFEVLENGCVVGVTVG